MDASREMEVEEPGGGVPGTVAVIVVSGVGDDRIGSGRDAIVDAFADDPDRRWTRDPAPGSMRLVAAADAGDRARDGGPLVTGKGSPNLREPFVVPTAHIQGRDGAPAIDVFEMHWADLSRAQGSIQRLFYLLFGITMQIATIAQEAVRRFPGELDPHGAGTRRRLGWALNAMSYWLVYVVTPIVLAMTTLAVAVNLQLLTKATGQTSWALHALLALGAGAAGWWIGGRVYRGGWTFDSPNDPWMYRNTTAGADAENPWPLRTLIALGLGFVGAALWLGSEAAQDLAIQVTYLIGVGLVAAAIATRIVAPPTEATDHPESTQTTRIAARRRVRTVIQAAYAALPLGAMLLAVLNEPRAGGAGVRTANALTMIAAGAFRVAWLVMLVLCSACVVLALWMRIARRPHREPRQRLSATVMLAVMLGPVLYALATSAMFLVFAAAWRIYPDYAKTWPDGQPLCPGATVTDPVAECPRAFGVRETADWGTDLVRAVIQPLGLALLLLAGAVTIVLIFFRPYLASFRVRNTHANAADIAMRQGRAFSRGLRNTGSDAMYLVYVGIVLLVTLAAAIIWLDDREPVQDIGGFLASVAFPLAFGIAVLAIAGVGLRNVSVAGRFGGDFLRVLGLVLDTIYDITTYLRVANPAIVAPRIRMMARYRAVLRHTRQRGYGHVVVMAHSQGTALSLATLLGDEDRAPRVTRPSPDEVPATLTFLSYGSPATQTYAQRFPGQFADWRSRATTSSSPIGTWLNVYRAGDYIGRWITAPPVTPDAPDTGPIRERCLGPGHHTGYLTDERWRRVARHVVSTPPGAVRLSDVSLADLSVATLDETPRLS